MRSRVIMVVVAFLLGGAAAVLAANYLRSARSEVVEQNKPVEVLVAQRNLPRGLAIETLVEKGYVKKQDVPAQFVAADAVSSERTIADQVLATPVSAGEQLTRSKFEFPADAGLSYTVPENKVGLSISVDDVSGVAGMLKPGDMVMVFASFEPKGKESAFTRTTVAKARVLAVGGATSAEATPRDDTEQKSSRLLASNTDEESTAAQRGETVYKTVTLALSPKDAESLAFAQEFGVIQLALLAQNAESPEVPKPTTYVDFAPRPSELPKGLK